MAYDRYDRDERSRWSNDRNDRGRPDDRGFWDRASDEVASWFGDEDAERRRRQDNRRDERDSDYRGRSGEHSAFGRGWGQDSSRDYDRGYGRDYDRDRASYERNQNDRDSNYDRGVFNRGGSSERDYNRGWRGELGGNRDWNETQDRNRSRSGHGGAWGSERDWNDRSDRDRNRASGRDQSWSQDRDWDRGRGSDRGYRPMTGDYGRGSYESDQFFAASGYGAGERGLGDYGRDYDRSQTPYGQDQYRRTSFAGSRRDEGDFDPHYRSWRDRHMSDLDRDYDDYRRENQSRFENDFTSWRQDRESKRGMLGQIREHMDVVGKDEKHVGTVDRVAGDRIILTKSDPESGGTHHSISCSDIDRVEGDKVILDCSAEEARKRWRDESRDRSLSEHEGQGEMGPRNLNRSFEGTYR